jgi:hypothetical protein
MKTLFSVLLGVVALVVAAPAAADPPTAFPIEDVFLDVNPCTGDTMTVTFVGIAFVHFHDSRTVVHAERTIAEPTSSSPRYAFSTSRPSTGKSWRTRPRQV